jgi:MFS superfamily sulfate permease-like transporter
VLYVAFFLVRVGWIADLGPDPVLKGFVEGAIWVTILKQVPAAMGLEAGVPSGGFFAKLPAIARALPEAHPATALLALASVAALWLLRRFARGLPGPLVVLAASTVLVWLLGLDRAGVAVVGAAGTDAPAFGGLALPGLDRLVELLPGALAIVVLGYTKSLGALKRAHAAEPGSEPIDPDRELLASAPPTSAPASAGATRSRARSRPPRFGSTREGTPRSGTSSPPC